VLGHPRATTGDVVSLGTIARTHQGKSPLFFSWVASISSTGMSPDGRLAETPQIRAGATDPTEP
jgi:hypothetical protein